MSTESKMWQEYFSAPIHSVQIYRKVREIMQDCFSPVSAFSSPPHCPDLDLLQDDGASMNDILDEVHRKIVRHAVNSRHPWAIAHMVPPPSTISVLADLIIGLMNQCAFIWEEAPLAHALEKEVLRWLLDRFDFEADAQGMLTSGGTMSNFLATFAALEREKRTRGSERQQLRIIASDQAHLSIEKAAVLSGLGAEAVVRVRTDEGGRLQPGQLRATARELAIGGLHPFLFICTAGTSNTGAIEPFAEILEAAREHGAWCHLDAAHGGLVCLCSDRQQLVSDWCLSDSIAWDPHKTLYTSYAVGALLLHDTAELAALNVHSEYALKQEVDGDAGRAHFEGSRRMEALKLWMTIKHFGVRRFSEAIDKTLRLAREFAIRIDADDDFVLVVEPDTNIVSFRYRNSKFEEDQLERLHCQVQERLFSSNGPLLSTTLIHKVRVFRCVFLNPMLEVDELDAIIGRIRLEVQRAVCVSPEWRSTYEYHPMHEPSSQPFDLPRSL